MRRALAVVAAGSLLALCTSPAFSLGFGRSANHAALGQPLAFEVRVTLADGEVLADTCAAATVQAGDSLVEASQVQASVQPLREGEVVVRVRTVQALVEPVVTLDLALGCPVRVSRQFVLLLDPPLVDETPIAAPAAPAPVAAQRRRNATRPAQARAAAVPTRPPAAAPVEARGPAGPRLSLDAPSAHVVAATDPPAGESSPASTPAASVATTAASEVAAAAALAADDRIRHLDEELARMRRENAEMRNSLASLHARVRAADAARDTRWVWALGLLSAALLIAVVWLLRRQTRMRERMSEWHEGHMSDLQSRAPNIDSELEDGESTAGAALPMQPSPPPWQRRPTSLDSPAAPAERPSPARAPAAPPAALSAPPAEPANVSRAERRALAVEELIDLEQQADFFLVLGQDEAAIDLLMTHVRSSGGESPMPYLKLLEIYRRRNDAEAYGRIRERFNRRFNAYAPAWVDEARPSTRALEDYPRVIERLQQVWSEPWQSLDLLDNLLFRPDSTDVSFDLPAYADLLFLYAVAGTLAESGGPVSRVDLLLPLDGEMSADEIPAIERTTPHLPNPEYMRASLDLSLDLDLDASASKVADGLNRPVV